MSDSEPAVQTDESAKEAFEQGASYLKEGNYAKALPLFEEVAKHGIVYANSTADCCTMMATVRKRIRQKPCIGS